MRNAIAAALSLAAGPALACQNAPPSVEVSLPVATVKVEQVRDVGAYASFGAGALGVPAGSGPNVKWTVNGLTMSRTSVGTRVEGVSGRDCFAFTKITIVYAVEDPVRVLIADRYAPGTCQYQAILEHEMQHVDVLRRGRAIYADRYKQFAALAAGYGPYRDMAQATARLAGLMDVVSDEMKGAIGTANASIDTAQSYMANQARCPGW